ncbi:Ppx/GppA phosphatase [Methanolacinia petrolearia DSM 11571]|uniref:Ppx/GppA phosphatase n=1 Tax=Methanolacinia petrolearia (strain DSM 11571 / OCM 486 / SEBR 4847) TaxID=679926 RepID=E1RG14_METP4|nr:Ppx/GppA phosphatase family protein [Methanolacinia petrolearia]ADN36249.1 Ppx/GppA phosphatase [Methanolacinia petrolearia DSM 11571]
MPDRTEEKIISFIDLGTNSARLLIARIYSNHSFSVLRRQKEIIRLGEGSFAQGVISEYAIERAIDLCRKYVEISQNFNVDEIHAVATSAARDAVNGQDLIHRIRLETGLDIKIISGEEEARLIYLGVSNNLSMDDRLCLFIDIGGGSTEIIVGSRFDYVYIKSLKLGALRTHFRFLDNSGTGVIDQDKREKIRKFVESKISYTKTEVLSQPVEKVYGSSGTIKALISLAEKYRNKNSSSNGENSADIAEIENVMLRLCGMSLEERRNIPGLNPARSDIVATGAIILHTLMKEMKIARIYSTDSSLRDGLLFDYMLKQPGFKSALDIPVKEKSVRHLGRSCRIDEDHAEHVTKLSRDLFESAKECGLHNYGPDELEMLEYAAYLHDIGQFVAFSGHQNHSCYMIMNKSLLGFNQEELRIIGLIANFHRKKVPKLKDEIFSGLEEETVKYIIVLSLFLRIAEHLERSHDGRVKRAWFSKSDKKLLVNIEPVKDCTIELRAMEDDLAVLENTFGLKAEINEIK